jgi:hypothetical protein
LVHVGSIRTFLCAIIEADPASAIRELFTQKEAGLFKRRDSSQNNHKTLIAIYLSSLIQLKKDYAI